MYEVENVLHYLHLNLFRFKSGTLPQDEFAKRLRKFGKILICIADDIERGV